MKNINSNERWEKLKTFAPFIWLVLFILGIIFYYSIFPEEEVKIKPCNPSKDERCIDARADYEDYLRSKHNSPFGW